MSVRDFAFHPVRVRAVRDVTPSFRRVTFAGEALAGMGDPGFDQRIKLVFPSSTAPLAAMPDGEDWYLRWREMAPEGRPAFRTYTIRHFRREARELDVDMVVHGDGGPAARWLAAARPGDEVLVLAPTREASGPLLGMDFVPPRRVGTLVLAGDETAAPAIARILEQCDPALRVEVVVEVPTAADASYLPERAGARVRVVAREGGEHGEALVRETRALLDALVPAGAGCAVEEIDPESALWEVPRTAKGGAALHSAEVYAWLAGEAGAVTALRRHLVGTLGVDRRAVAFMGYWRRGRAEN